eukprot:scaffold1190_cov187-Ochromonas_danica.AAC.2
MMSKTGGSSSSSSGGSDSSIWVKCVDEKEGRLYWYNTLTGASLWTSPDDNNELVVEERDRIAVIVPFRDLHAQQQRLQQLKQFIPEMTKFLLQGELYKIEQQCLSFMMLIYYLREISYLSIRRYPLMDLYILLRDGIDIIRIIDILEGLLSLVRRDMSELMAILTTIGVRLSDSSLLLLLLLSSMTRLTNGMGWNGMGWVDLVGTGWGGEDDELRNRIEATGTVISSEPRVGQIYDMEQKGLEEKLAELRAQPEIKCMHKKELLTEHEATWRSNGLTSFAREEHYKVIKAESLTPYALKVTVDLSLNGHWTDQKCVE